MFSLRQLEHFAVLVEEKSYTSAAQRLHVTQSALSRSIQSLEATLDLRLLDRTPGGVSLTQSGQFMLQHVEHLLTGANALKRDAIMLRGHNTGKVRFGAGVFPAAAFLSPLLRQIAIDYPRISIHVEIESWHRLLDKLDRKKLDFVVAITHSLPPSSQYATRPLPNQTAGLFVRADHPLLKVSPSALTQQIMRYGLATTDLPPRARQQLATVYGLSDSEQLPITLECNNIDALRDVAMSGDTVLFSTREAIFSSVQSGHLVQLPMAYSDGANLTCSIIHHAHLTLTPAVETVIDLIQTIIPVLEK